MSGERPPLLFLDIDGVLNVRTKSGRDFTELQPHLLNSLRRVLRTTGAKVVLSSTWRLDSDLMDHIRSVLAKSGIETSVIIGQTPDLKKPGQNSISMRAEEIMQWLTMHDAARLYGPWVVVDDQDVPGAASSQGIADLMGQHFVQTDDKTGLEEEMADRVQGLLLDL